MSGSKYSTYSGLMPIFLNNQRDTSQALVNIISVTYWRLPCWSSGLRLSASNAEGVNSIPDWRTKIPHTTQHGQNKYKVT